MAEFFVLVEDMSWFDSHCHLQIFLQREELESVLQKAEAHGIQKMLTVGTDPDDWGEYQKLAQAYPGKIIYSAGLHPGYVDANWELKLSGLMNFWQSQIMPSALGEIGLDYFRLSKDQKKAQETIRWQKKAFREQLHWARELDCPVIIHSRSAFDDCVDEIDNSGINWARVVFHCFTEGTDEIQKIIERGGRASFTGIITFPKNEKLLEAVKLQGLEKLMIETDSPYLAPVPYRGQRNEPANLVVIGEFLSVLFDKKIADIESIISENTESFFTK